MSAEAYDKIQAWLGMLTDGEIDMLAGALVGEFVNRGNDTDTALARVKAAADGGAAGSRLFDQLED